MWKRIIIVLTLLAPATYSWSQSDDELKLANEYYSNGEYEKARIIYDNLARDIRKIPVIHDNYYSLLLSIQDFKAAENYIERVIKRYPSSINYRLDMGLLYKNQNKEGTMDKYFRSIIKEISVNVHLVRYTANYFILNNMYDYSQITYLESRKELNNEYLFCLEMANLYRVQNKRDLMVNEYLNYIISNPTNLRFVQNTLQNLLTETSDLESFEKLLYAKIQEDPASEIYSELLIWVNLQLKNFYGAFVQARAMDRRGKLQGNKSMEIGYIALNNGDFSTAIKIFEWVIDSYPGTSNYFRARMQLIRSYEMKVKNSYPISEEDIRLIINDYKQLTEELGSDQTAFEAMRNRALLHAFYLDEKDTAIELLNHIVTTIRNNPPIKSQSKLDLGDIYLLSGEPWEATLLYSQVEKEVKESPLAYEAKLKNARLSYFSGDFLLAQEHLDIIKQATTREISNDAMQLSLLIKDNISLDSTEEAMKMYASIDLLLFQNKTEEGLQAIQEMYRRFPNHSLTDELLWLEASLYLKQGQFDRVVSNMEKIEAGYSYDVLGDDAAFLKAEVYERHLHQSEKAMELYLEFLTDFPGSVFSAEARKRFRTLRGDFNNL